MSRGGDCSGTGLPRLLLSVDPGASRAAIAVFVDGRLRWVEDLPSAPRPFGRGKLVDVTRFRDQVFRFMEDSGVEITSDDRAAVMEAVWSGGARNGAGAGRRSMGSVSADMFGRGNGRIEGVLLTLGFPLDYVYPVNWKRHFGLFGKGKEESRDLARRFYPGMEPRLSRIKDENRAEAILIGRYWIESRESG